MPSKKKRNPPLFVYGITLKRNDPFSGLFSAFAIGS